MLIGYDHFARLWDLVRNAEVWRNEVPEADAVNAVAGIDNAGTLFAYSTMAGILSINRYETSA